MNPQIEQQLIMMAQQKAQAAAQGQQDQQAQALVQAETIRAQAKAQSDLAKIQLDAQKSLAEDDRKRDEMDQELLIKAAELIAKYGTAVDVERIKQMQQEQRFADTTPQEAIVQARF
jgi:Flp pilus assembly protein TadB